MAREARRRQRGGDVREPGECCGGSGGASRAARRPGLRPPSGSWEAGWRPAREQRQQRRRLRRVSVLPVSLSRGRPGGPGGCRGSAAREWEFSSPGYGDCSITRVRGSGRGPAGGGERPPWTGGGVSAHFRSVGGVVARGPCAGSGGGGAGLGWPAPLPVRARFPTRSSLS